VKGFFTERLKLEYLQINGLSVFGEDCFLETESVKQFQTDKCFYGNIELKLDLKDYNFAIGRAFYQQLSIV